MKTYRRDKLRRQVEAGKVTTVSTYHFDDMFGESRTNKEMPVMMRPADWKDMKEGTVYLFPSDFTSKSGSAWEENGFVVLYVHSNSNYTFKVRP